VSARDDLAARLAEHSQVRILGWRCRSCGVPLSQAGSADSLAAHRADVALAWFEEQTTEEWGTKNGTGALRTDTEAIARTIADQHPRWDLVNRRVTAWKKA
jgi:hypothetical protein